jgi:hypothetical protein
MEHNQFAACSGRVRKNDNVLRPTEDSVNCRFGWSHIWNWDVLLEVAEIRNIRFQRYALAKVFRLYVAEIGAAR